MSGQNPESLTPEFDALALKYGSPFPFTESGDPLPESLPLAVGEQIRDLFAAYSAGLPGHPAEDLQFRLNLTVEFLDRLRAGEES